MLKKIKTCIFTLSIYLLLTIIVYYICKVDLDLFSDPRFIVLCFITLIIIGLILYFLLSQKHSLFLYIVWSILSLYLLCYIVYAEFFVQKTGGFISFSWLEPAAHAILLILYEVVLFLIVIASKGLKKFFRYIKTELW